MDEAIAEIGEASKLQKLQRGFSVLWRGLVDVITPPLCLSCGGQVMQPASLCVECWGRLRFLDLPVCEVMGTPFAYDQGEGILSAEALADPPGWDRSRAAVLFDNHSKEIVHQLKYRDRAEAGIFMARLMARAGHALLREADFIVPVPLHRGRLWRRRFNQAAVLAQRIAGRDGPAYQPEFLVRSRATAQQVGLSAKERRRNVKGAFSVPFEAKALLAGKCIVLVDDVRTTGSTLRACTEALREAGAGQIHVLTFALVNDVHRFHIEG
ncbi:MAG: ComF family protein [Aestuariivirga sp.]